MHFPTPLLHGQFMKRYKRFFADVQLDNGTVVTAHCANTGSMQGLLDPSFGAWVMPVDKPDAKLKYKLELIETPTSLVGVNTSRPNHIVQEALAAKAVPELAAYDTIKPEVKYGANSRIDVLLQGEGLPDCYVEVKNTTLADGDTALFPDAVTTRGTKHLNELMEMVQQGHRAVMLYLVNRSDCTHFMAAKDIDPTYAQTLQQAQQKGVELLAYQCKVSPEEIVLVQKLEIRL